MAYEAFNAPDDRRRYNAHQAMLGDLVPLASQAVDPGPLCTRCQSDDVDTPGLFQCSHPECNKAACADLTHHNQLHRPGGAHYHSWLPVSTSLRRAIERLHVSLDSGAQERTDGYFELDRVNCFLEFESRTLRLQPSKAFARLLPCHNNRHRIPSLISFIGESGIGKSTLLEALIIDALWTIQPPQGSTYSTPSVSEEQDTSLHCSTMHSVDIPLPGVGAESGSANIHRYCDPLTWHAANPIVYLDCEGFDGSTQPQAMQWALGTIQAATGIAQDRTRVVNELLPMLTYAFSDIIVLVVTSKTMHRKIQDLFERLREGAERVSNMRVKPCLVVVCTRIEQAKLRSMRLPPFEDWQLFFSELTFMNVADLSSRGFASDIHRLSVKLRTLRAQVELLRADTGFMIDASKLLAHIRMVVASIERAGPRTTGPPNFDWILATRDLRPLPQTLEAKLISFANAVLIPSPANNDFAGVVDSVLLTHLARCIYDYKLDRPLVHYPDPLPPVFDAAVLLLEEHIRNLEPCGFKRHGHGCTNLRGSHERHQFATATGWNERSCAGIFVPSSSNHLDLAAKLREHLAKIGSLRRNASAYEAIASLPTPDLGQYQLTPQFKSNSVCLRCLVEVPYYALKCGHSLCKSCQSRCADRDLTRAVCPLHEVERVAPTPGPVCPSPLQPGCNYRILSLSGGGVRGLGQVIVLEQLSKACYDIPIACLFDLVVGTSIGGCLALALLYGEKSRVSLTTSHHEPRSNARQAFKTALNQSFHKSQRLNWVQWLLATDRVVRYRPDGLRAAMCDLLRQEGSLADTSAESMFSGRADLAHRRMPHVALVASQILDSWVPREIPNFVIGTNDSDSISESTTLLDAAQATSAAWPYLPTHMLGGTEYFDGAFSANTPARFAETLAERLWEASDLDLIVSIGTGVVQTPTHEDLSRRHASYWQILTAAANIITDSTGVHGAPQCPPHLQAVFNPAWEGPLSRVDDLEAMQDIENRTLEWCMRPDIQDRIKSTARGLLSLTWYVDPTDRDGSDKMTTLHLKSRLPHDEAIKLVQQELSECRASKQSNAFKLFAIEQANSAAIEIDVREAFEDFLQSSRSSEYSCHLDITFEVSTPEGPDPLKLNIKYGHGHKKQPISNAFPWTSPI